MTYRTGCCRMRCRWAGRRTGTGMRRTTSGFITRRATGRRSGRSGGARGENLGKWSFSYHWDSDSESYVGDFHATASNVYFAGKLISDGNQVCSGGNCTRAVFQDQVGTNRASGARFYPYGDEIGGFTATSNDREKFGTYVRDSFSGLDYADQRYYASSYGRFNTADPFAGSAGPGNPLSWNRYAYALSDPINGSDPTGRCTQTSDGQYWDDVDKSIYWFNEGTVLVNDGVCGDITSPGSSISVSDSVDDAPYDEDASDEELNWTGDQYAGLVPSGPDFSVTVTGSAPTVPPCNSNGLRDVSPSEGQQIINNATKFLGTPYGSGPGQMVCTGLACRAIRPLVPKFPEGSANTWGNHNNLRVVGANQVQ